MTVKLLLFLLIFVVSKGVALVFKALNILLYRYEKAMVLKHTWDFVVKEDFENTVTFLENGWVCQVVDDLSDTIDPSWIELEAFILAFLSFSAYIALISLLNNGWFDAIEVMTESYFPNLCANALKWWKPVYLTLISSILCIELFIWEEFLQRNAGLTIV